MFVSNIESVLTKLITFQSFIKSTVFTVKCIVVSQPCHLCFSCLSLTHLYCSSTVTASISALTKQLLLASQVCVWTFTSHRLGSSSLTAFSFLVVGVLKRLAPDTGSGDVCCVCFTLVMITTSPAFVTHSLYHNLIGPDLCISVF